VDCSVDICAAARCGAHGACAALYLGESTLPVTSGMHACICDESWKGPLCDTHEILIVASASSSKKPAKNAIDSSMSTRWESESSDTQWLSIDLGQMVPLSSVELVWEGAYGKQYEIQVSGDGLAWTTAFTETNGDGGTDVIDISESGYSGRYIRMYGTKRATGYGYSLWEVKVSGPSEVYLPCACTTLNDCEIVDTCFLNGTCSTPIPVLDGTPCNTAPHGICAAGVCMATPTPPPTVMPTRAPTTSAPTVQPTITSGPTILSSLIPISSVTASPSELQAADKAIDGSMSTRWESVHGQDNQWIRVDLGMSVSISSVELFWEGKFRMK